MILKEIETITSDTTTRTNGLTSTEENTRTNFTGSAGNKAKIIHREFMAGGGSSDTLPQNNIYDLWD
jgi:hypothetical protein